MKITVSGKAHLEGVSRKTNNPFNFNQIYYLSPARGFYHVSPFWYSGR